MGFFARLKWLLVGEGEAPSSFKSTVNPTRRPEHSSPRSQSHGRDRNPRDRDNNRGDSRGPGYSRDPRGPREPRDNRDSRPPREPRDPRDRDRSSSSRQDYGRDRPMGDRYSERGDRNNGPRRSGPQGGGYSQRDSSGGDTGFPRVERPSGGPSSTMRPAQSSAQESAPRVAPRPEQQGPEKIGVVTQYLDQDRIANIKIEKGSIRSGDWIEIQGNISSLRQKADAIQLDSQPVQEAQEGQEVGVRVIRPVKVGDAVVRLRG